MLSPTTGIHDFKLYDQIRYGTRINIFSSLLMVVMNKERFASLPDFARKALDEASGKNWGLRAAGIYDRLDADITAKMKTSGRVRLDEFSPAEKQRFLERLKPMDADWAAHQTDRQIPAKDILTAMRAAIKGNP
jgi:TRAP-type C4-dicarboxylate transport system substrate-binding protein